MATHEQTYLGEVIDGMVADGFLTLADDVNSYGFVAEMCVRAGALGVVINADDACDDCLAADPDADPAKVARAREVNLQLFGHVSPPAPSR